MNEYIKRKRYIEHEEWIETLKMALLKIREVKCYPAGRDTETRDSSPKGEADCLFHEFFTEFGGLYWPSTLAKALLVSAHVRLARRQKKEIGRPSLRIGFSKQQIGRPENR